jgi:agmatinase
MPLPFEYDGVAAGEFAGTPATTGFDKATVVVLPIPLDRTTTYVAGTRNGPREILVASSHLELWDEETSSNVHHIGIFTLPEMELPFATMDEVLNEVRRVAGELVTRSKFPVVLGGEHSITAPVVAALAERHAGLSVLQIDAHADLRESFMGTPHNHACAMRRVLDHAPVTQVGIRSLSPEEARDIPSLRTRLFYDFDMRSDPAVTALDWIPPSCRPSARPNRAACRGTKRWPSYAA